MEPLQGLTGPQWRFATEQRSPKALLQKAGVTDLSLKMIDPPAFGGASELKSQMEAIAADLGKVGIKVDTTLTDLAGYLASTKDNDIAVTVPNVYSRMNTAAIKPISSLDSTSGLDTAFPR